MMLLLLLLVVAIAMVIRCPLPFSYHRTIIIKVAEMGAAAVVVIVISAARYSEFKCRTRDRGSPRITRSYSSRTLCSSTRTIYRPAGAVAWVCILARALWICMEAASGYTQRGRGVQGARASTLKCPSQSTNTTEGLLKLKFNLEVLIMANMEQLSVRRVLVNVQQRRVM
jgi:hypothetical protein